MNRIENSEDRETLIIDGFGRVVVLKGSELITEAMEIEEKEDFSELFSKYFDIQNLNLVWKKQFVECGNKWGFQDVWKSETKNSESYDNNPWTTPTPSETKTYEKDPWVSSSVTKTDEKDPWDSGYDFWNSTFDSVYEDKKEENVFNTGWKKTSTEKPPRKGIQTF
jgi:hypothetical protein